MISAISATCSNMNKSIDDAVIKLAKDLDLNPEFFNFIVREDDWSFIIKLHALIEAAITELLTSHLGKGRLNEVIQRMTLNGKSGRIAFVKALDLLSPGDITFVRQLSKLRNSWVHKIKNVNMNLHLHVKHLSEKEFAEFSNALGVTLGASKDKKQLMKDNPKISIHLRAFLFLSELYSKKQSAIIQQALESIASGEFDFEASLKQPSV
jgi:hypothetical protein